MIPGIAPGGEIPAGILADEILVPGEGRIRGMFVEGGNPAVAVPDQRRTVVSPPEGAEVIDDWYLYWSLAKRLGQTIDYRGTRLDGDEPPTTDELIALTVRDGQVPYEELVRHPHGKVFDELEPLVAQPPRPEAHGRFAVMPDDVWQELSDYRRSSPDDGCTHRLTVRRMRHVMNSLDPAAPTPPYNPAFLHPDDMLELGLAEGDRVQIVSDHSRIAGIAQPDDRLRRGVVSMSHCFGGLPGEDEDPEAGACTGRLVDARRHRQAINAMPTMSGLPVRAG
jgi:anaerobic selenocysteine-containing dehydrogenase